MKNLAKIFMAITVGLFAFSCATDTTENLGIEVGKGDGMELVLSLEGARTHLGEKADGIYPVYWSQGDKISVNGVESGEAIIGSNPATATFVVNVVADKLCVAYPAATEGQVLFAENQGHVAAGNTFANGVATMYGVNTAEGIKLHHLTGVLKISVKGSATLTHAQISTIDRAPIAGAFGIDFESGELTATAASKSVINYSFGTGLQLSNEVQYLHIAVPTGVYDELYVTLYDNADGVMYATAKADSTNPLAAGSLRNFKSAIEYAATDKVVVIKNEADLKAFAAAAATLSLERAGAVSAQCWR